jgi:hypothetical protein
MKGNEIMKTRNIAFTTILLLLSCFALSPVVRADPPLPFHALLQPPPEPDRIIGTLETLLTSVIGNPEVFQLSGQVRLSPPPDGDFPYTFGEIVRDDGAVVTGIGNPDERGNETFFIIYALVSADVAAEMRQNPNAFMARFYNDGGLAAEGRSSSATHSRGGSQPLRARPKQ